MRTSSRPSLALAASMLALSLAACELPHAMVRLDGSTGRDREEFDAVADVPTGPSCDGGTIACGNACVMPSNDPANCGRCGAVCPAPGPGQVSVCNGGACERRCAANFGDCDGNPMNGCETDLQTSVTHCGACNRNCPVVGGTAACAMGTCGITCGAGRGDCDGDSSNGCESMTNTVDNCGACGRRCDVGTRMNVTASCGAMGCAFACNPGFADCDGNVMNGCEAALDATTSCGACGRTCTGGTPICDGAMRACVSGCTAPAMRCGMSCVDVNTSVTNCGMCGRACSLPNATEVCRAGVCGVGTCDPGFADCDGNPANGCEVNLQTSLTHCGACNAGCNPPNGTGSCMAGTCRIASCSAGFENCDMNNANGCEANTRTSATNCGRCGMTCTFANATATCSGGACAIGGCNTGFANCDMNNGNGCETNTNVNVAHCGACGRACSSTGGTATCGGGFCGIMCGAGFGNCDMNLTNGCETNTNTTVTNCGMCGRNCAAPANAAAACAGGVCGLGACNMGFANCDMNAANGCEAATNADPANCGTCGMSCSMSQQCTAGACAACPMGQARCNLLSNTCVDTQSSATNCGMCGRACGAGQSCSMGACTCNTGTPCGGTPGAPAACCTAAQTCSMGGMCVTTPADAGGSDAANDA